MAKKSAPKAKVMNTSVSSEHVMLSKQDKYFYFAAFIIIMVLALIFVYRTGVADGMEAMKLYLPQ